MPGILDGLGQALLLAAVVMNWYLYPWMERAGMLSLLYWCGLVRLWRITRGGSLDSWGWCAEAAPVLVIVLMNRGIVLGMCYCNSEAGSWDVGVMLRWAVKACVTR